jgi:hypothetical protein
VAELSTPHNWRILTACTLVLRTRNVGRFPHETQHLWGLRIVGVASIAHGVVACGDRLTAARKLSDSDFFVSVRRARRRGSSDFAFISQRCALILGFRRRTTWVCIQRDIHRQPGQSLRVYCRGARTTGFRRASANSRTVLVIRRRACRPCSQHRAKATMSTSDTCGST